MYSKLNTVAITALVSVCMLQNTALASSTERTISFKQAIELAQQNDPWLHGNKLTQSAIEAKSIAAGTLPDPKVSISMQNLPTDTWDVDQEAMSQFKIGITQQFARGDELKLKRQQLAVDATKYPLLRAERKAKVSTKVAQLWLDAYLAQRTIQLINDDKALFEQLADITKASYSSAFGKTKQNDVIRSQLELIQLEDRLTVEKQKFEAATAQLNEWLHLYKVADASHVNFDMDFDQLTAQFSVENKLPTIRLAKDLYGNNGPKTRNQIAQILLNHPSILIIDVKQQVAAKGIALANQQYQPQWGVNSSYAYRDNTQSGVDRADLFSVGVTFDLPLFTENRQDKQLNASVAQAEAIKTDKLLLLKNMITQIDKELQNLKRISQRQTLYKTQLIEQTKEQAEASLSAYTNDDGNFSEVVRARIVELNTSILALQIDVNALKTISRINYYLTQTTAPIGGAK